MCVCVSVFYVQTWIFRALNHVFWIEAFLVSVELSQHCMNKCMAWSNFSEFVYLDMGARVKDFPLVIVFTELPYEPVRFHVFLNTNDQMVL